MRGEDELVASITRAFPAFHRGLGIGDDAALVGRSGSSTAITTDMLIEGVDFTDAIPPELIAAKSLAVNLSDLAAMGAEPEVFFLSLGVPERWMQEFDRFIEALARSASDYGIELAGGDLSSSRDLTISITAMGRAPDRPLLRSAATPDQRVFVSRPIGGSAAGLRLLESGWRIDRTEIVHEPEGRRADFMQRDLARSAILRHVAPEPEIALGRQLAAMAAVGACIDLSDGLSTDLHRLCEASGTGAVVEWERIPSLPDLDRVGPQLGINVPECVLHGGEDFALLFTASLREAEASTMLGRPVYAIGRITADREVLLERAGTRTPLPRRGWDHFVTR